MTLALFEDSGWWKPDYAQATTMSTRKNTGYKRGCNFVNNKCLRSQPTMVPAAPELLTVQATVQVPTSSCCRTLLSSPGPV